MLTYPNIDPVALHVYNLKIHWYGIAYILGFATAWLLALHRCRKYSHPDVNLLSPNPNNPNFIPTVFAADQISDFIFCCALGVIIGGRVGYIIFYHFSNFLASPLTLLKVWEGGMSFHGGIIGVVIGLLYFAKKTKKSFAEIADFTAPLVPIGLFFGRIGNFINGELWGRVTDMPWGMIFPHVGSWPRHPSQLYEAFFEGIVLFTFIWIYSAKPRARGKVASWFLIGYGCVRFFCEFFRAPDLAVGFVACNWLTMGQLLSLPMIIIGTWWLAKINQRIDFPQNP
jgi:phosphatidylglycerol---prolipoprotein diacylglyceryl transferase